MNETLLDLFSTSIAEIFPSFLKKLGATFKWLVFLGRKKYSTILSEDWNHRIGFLVLVLISIITLSIILTKKITLLI